jgi:hypothetical protein
VSNAVRCLPASNYVRTMCHPLTCQATARARAIEVSDSCRVRVQTGTAKVAVTDMVKETVEVPATEMQKVTISKPVTKTKDVTETVRDVEMKCTPFLYDFCLRYMLSCLVCLCADVRVWRSWLGQRAALALCKCKPMEC